MYSNEVKITEVGPRDGFQSITDFISTDLKIEIIEKLIKSGCKSIQLTSFVSPKAIPQMKDAKNVCKELVYKYPNIEFSALVPNLKGAELAIEAGISKIGYVISVSESHNRANVNKTVDESFLDLKNIVEKYRDADICLNAATVFGCPFEDKIQVESIIDFIKKGIEIGINKFNLCDTIGVANPKQVKEIVNLVKTMFKEVKVGVHFHDTRNNGIVNTIAAIECGILEIETAIGGMGGCPFAPGASGNTATEDLVYLLEQMDIKTNIKFEEILDVAKFVANNINGNYSSHNINITKECCVQGG